MDLQDRLIKDAILSLFRESYNCSTNNNKIPISSVTILYHKANGDILCLQKVGESQGVIVLQMALHLKDV